MDNSGNLYIGGGLSAVGETHANCVAKWDGHSWTTLGSGVGGSAANVLALVVSGTDVYAGGVFTTAGGRAATNIAKWDGSSWTSLGSGVDSGVNTLAISGNTVYAGGYFRMAGRSMANYIAKWDGNNSEPALKLPGVLRREVLASAKAARPEYPRSGL